MEKMNGDWSTEEIETLIRLVKANEGIYNRSHPLHNSQEYLKKAWSNIAVELNHPVKRIRDKWKNMRDLYRMKLYKKQDAPETDNGSIWPFYEQMSFLEFHMRVRNVNRNSSRKSIKRERYSEDSNDVNSTTICHNSFNNIEMVTVEGFDPSVLDCVNYQEPETSSMANKSEILPSNRITLAPSELEEDRCFFESLLPYMKTLSPRDKMLCRMRIQEVVYSIAFPEEPHKKNIELGD